MKKIILLLAGLFVFSAQATPLEEGKQYISLNQPHSAQTEVVEFFSFYCPHCYSFEYEFNIPNQVKESLPKEVSFKQYHVNFLGRQSENLTRAWALAMAIGVEQQVKKPLFDAAQANKLSSMADIRQIFIDNGVSAEQFDGGINSFAVTALVNQQVNLAQQFEVRGVPDFYVNGKFRVNPEGLSHNASFADEYIGTIQGLLNK